MGDFLRKQWFYSAVQFVSVLLWLWWVPYDHLPWAGVSIAVVAVQAAVMSVHGQMRGWQKFIWLIIIGAFLSTEFRAIRKDRNEAEQEALQDRAAQNREFAGVLSTENTTFATTTQGFSDTEKKVDGVLSQTQTAARLSAENLQNVTGGESYAYIWPNFVEGSGIADVKIHNFGTNALSGVTVKVYPVIRGSILPFGNTMEDTVTATPIVMDIGTLPPGIGQNLSNLAFRPTSMTYQIYISAQNGISSEILSLRPIKGSYAYKLEVWTKAWGQRRKGDILVAPNTKYQEWMRQRVNQGWVEPMPQ